ncbi:MAG: transglycosylase domain-containing protein, partial [Fibrobacteria bacterium]|nr:transglycosylase domain-containing protein [Fibrobacteria bacterium]
MQNLKKKKSLKKVLLLFTLLLIIFSIPFGLFQYSVHQNPDGLFTREGILSILSKESTVYYRDKKSRIGTFFEDIHRDYISYDSIPTTLIHAVTSAEDKNFFKHGGMDFKAILYAMLDNVKSLAIRRGGSTLTQQTAKNLFPTHGFGKWNRIKAKIPELVNAYR